MRQAAQQSKADAGAPDELEQLRPAFSALKAWSAVPRKARDALKRAHISVVDDLEMPILEFLSKVRETGVQRPVPGSYYL